MTKETETAIEKPNYLAMFKRVVTLDEVCPVHNVHYQQLNKAVLIAGENKPRQPKPYVLFVSKRAFLKRNCPRLRKAKIKVYISKLIISSKVKALFPRS